ncbi:hypothetical protein [Cohnella fermenti]|uniref:PPM-type phosphatase domain-containing protein n=1 Tax=Cohnella fermenti TaxID=2565925 RepID=A0A4S4BJP5_9BACL|nr:hypothetical protein [Cohnella fermenti]THF73932.1 hypothetical protein E6C55_27060 [Cohnella fermenti]
MSQRMETEVRQRILCEGREYSYGYSRSRESRLGGEPGQDYLTFAESAEALCFALCDGIGLSYYGDYAARFVGDRLIDWLAELPRANEGGAELSYRLDRYMRQMTAEATEQLREHEIPPTITGMLREVLSVQKKKGSGTMYGAGRIDWPSAELPEGRIVLVWQGDIRIRLWADGVEASARLGDNFHTRHQWNSVAGPVGGPPCVHCDKLASLGRRGALTIYSDGLQALDRFASPLPVPQLATLLNGEARHPSSDDISVFQANWELSAAGINAMNDDSVKLQEKET